MKPAALIIALIFAAVGCSTPVNSVERAQPFGHPKPVADRRIITNSAISDIAEVVAVNESVVSANLIKVEIRVYNPGLYEATFNYKFEWFDAHGMIVDSPMSIWQPKTIEANEEISLIAVAPNPNAKDFRLKLQASQ
jgi:uncharacterized protein YcfL